MKTLPTLYKLTSKGAPQEWTIAVDKATIITTYGQVGGKLQEARDVILSGKNLGKKNATTKEEQALAEAEAQWEKKLKKGYVKTIKDAKAGKTDSIIKGGAWPMLAEKFRDYADELVYPCYTQPKLDGHRCLAHLKDGKVTLWSRTRKPIYSAPHIIQELEAFFADHPFDDVFIDGELYNHAYKKNFEELSEKIRASEPVPGYEDIQFHIYDAYAPNNKAWVYDDRKQWVSDLKGPSLFVVETQEAADEDELIVWFEHFLELGYEGSMARNKHSVYKSVSATARSRDLLKVKKFDDDEFEVIAVEEGRGKMAGHAIFVCKTAKGVEFRAKKKGPIHELQKIFNDADKYIGKDLTVRYQGYTKYGKPRFPVGVRMRVDI